MLYLFGTGLLHLLLGSFFTERSTSVRDDDDSCTPGKETPELLGLYPLSRTVSDMEPRLHSDILPLSPLSKEYPLSGTFQPTFQPILADVPNGVVSLVLRSKIPTALFNQVVIMLDNSRVEPEVTALEANTWRVDFLAYARGRVKVSL